MRNKFIVILLLTVMQVGFAQDPPKKILKSAAKALKSGDLTTANESLGVVEQQLADIEPKLKAQYYFLKGQLADASPSEDITTIKEAADAYSNVIEIEKEAGSKYTAETTTKLQLLRQKLIESAIEDQNAKKFLKASEKLYLGYTTHKKDTVYLYYAAGNAVNGKAYDIALDYYNQLKDLNFNGVETRFVATNKESGTVESFNSEQLRDIAVKAGTHIKPEVQTTPSKKS